MSHRERAPDREGHPDRGDAIASRPAASTAASTAPDDIFADFVRHANAEWIASVEAVLSDCRNVGSITEDELEPAAEGTDLVVLLTQKKSHRPGPFDEVTVRKSAEEVLAEAKSARRRRAPAATIPAPPPLHEAEWQSVVPHRSADTQRLEAQRIVPDVASVPPPAEPVQEGSEDGQMPSGELDRKLSDMDVLLRYGHDAQVEAELLTLRSHHPSDLLLVRRIAELYVARNLAPLALEALFALATGLFERRNVEGMRQALEQVLVLDPENARATRLLALLEQRPSAPPPSRR